MHGLKLVIKEDVMPQEQMPHFPALEKLAANGFLAVETWNNKRAILNFKATVEIPMLGTMIESYGDTLDESHMPLGWPMSIDGAVRQFCMHKRDTIQELNSMLAEFNLQRSSVEINRNTNLWAHNAVWNKKHGPRSRTIPTAAMGCLRTLHLPKGVQIQGGPRRSKPCHSAPSKESSGA